MEILIHIIALFVCFMLAAVKTLQFKPAGVSDYELERRVASGDPHAIAERDRRPLLPTLVALRLVKQWLMTVILLVLLVATYPSVLGALFAGLYLLLAEVIATKGWFFGFSSKLQRTFEPHLFAAARSLKGMVGWMTPPADIAQHVHIASRDELQTLIAHDTHLLREDDKATLLGAMEFNHLVVGDIMMPKTDIPTVDIDETVGPVLLDRLHKQGHPVFVAVKKDLTNIKGLLYMRDLVPLDPSIKKVKDAIRPSLKAVQQDAPLRDMVATSLQTGRQLFIVVDDTDAAVGLVTLADALAKLMGTDNDKTKE